MRRIKYIQAVNNSTNGLYEWSSKNAFGLFFVYPKEYPGMIIINQYTELGDNPKQYESEAVARITNFSIIQIHYYD